MRRENGDIIMNDGSKYGVASGIIGLDEELKAFQGYDDDLSELDALAVTNDWLDSAPVAHKVELADYMISLWQAYRSTSIEVAS